MSVKLLTEHHLGFLSLKRGCTGSSESTLVKMPHCWKSHVAAQMSIPEDNRGLRVPETREYLLEGPSKTSSIASEHFATN